MTTSSTERRADARRNFEAILDAAERCLARDPDATLQQIADAAGVGRVTLYGHVGSRRALLETVTERAMAATEAALTGLDLDGDPAEAMTRLLDVTWDLTHRHGALVTAAQRELPADRVQTLHEAPVARARALLQAGRRSGAFDTTLPVSWQLTAIQALLHGAVAAVHRGDLAPDNARRYVARTALATLRPA